MSRLRITGGELGGRRLAAPKGLDVRPTADKVKEALFAILGGAVIGARCLDLFAGSGALGIEAMSRGAASCLLVERGAKALEAIRANLASLDLDETCQVRRGDASGQWLLSLGEFDLILADPPYGQGLAQKVVGLAGRGLLAPGGRLVIEHAPHERPQEQGEIALARRRAYGQTELSFFTWSSG